MSLADSQTGSTAVGIVVWLVLIALYWSPTIVGMIMRKHNLGVIAVWNFFGWFFLFPFIIAWVKVVEKPQQPTVVFAPPGYGPPYGFQPPQDYPIQPPPYSGERLQAKTPPPNPTWGPPQPQAKTDEWYR